MASQQSNDHISTTFSRRNKKSKSTKKKKKVMKYKKKPNILSSDCDSSEGGDYGQQYHYIKKLHSYIKKGRLKKLHKIVSVFKYHRWNSTLVDEINRKKTEKQWTYLHRFCSEGNSIMINVLLDLNADVSIRDKCENNFLHIAFHYILESFNRGFLSYITEKVLTQVNPSLMEGRNRYGETPVDMLHETLNILQNKQAFQFVENEIESESEINEINEIKWNEKLFFEMGQEKTFCYEGFVQDEFNDTYKKTKSETFTEWGDRIWKEYNRKRKPTVETTRSNHKRQRCGPENSKQKDTATDNLKQLKTNLLLLERREKYEESCHRLFKVSRENDELGIDDFPWTHFSQYNSQPFDEQAVLSSILETFNYGFTDEEKMKYFKVQRIRWHPDKFLQKCGHRLKGSDKERIMNFVKTLSQTINATLSSLQPPT